MAKQPRKTVSFNRRGIEKIPNDKPAVYRILTEGGRNNYTGIAQRGRVQERIREHLSGGKDPIPGSKVRVELAGSIADARARESRIISRSRPTHNKLGK